MKISEHLSRIFDKIDYLEGSLRSIDKTLERQSIILDEHVKRTNLLEAELKPIKHFVVTSKNTGKVYLKIIMLISVILGIAVALVTLKNGSI